jgi:uncharacterized protein
VDRSSYVLAVLSAGGGRAFTPVQLQKLFFVLDRCLAGRLGGPFFEHRPYHYGPFDAVVYRDVEKLESRADAEVHQPHAFAMKSARLTAQGQARGAALLASIEPDSRGYIEDVVRWVQRLSFKQLVEAVYREFPEMRANSIYRDQ